MSVAPLVLSSVGRRRPLTSNIRAIRQPGWSDTDLEGAVVFRRKEHETTGHEHRTQLTVPAIAALGEAGRQSPRDRGRARPPRTDGRVEKRQPPVDGGWWRQADRLEGLESRRGSGRHWSTALGLSPEHTVANIALPFSVNGSVSI